jgi:hypothetical protein
LIYFAVADDIATTVKRTESVLAGIAVGLFSTNSKITHLGRRYCELSALMARYLVAPIE